MNEPTIPKNGLNDWYAGVFAVHTRRRKVPLVRDHAKKNPQWKFPGGGKEDGETPEETAVRELRQETGVVVNPDDLILICEEDRGNHTYFVFMIMIEEDWQLLAEGDEGEEVDEFSLSDLPRMAKLRTSDGLLPSHWKAAEPIITEALSEEILP